MGAVPTNSETGEREAHREATYLQTGEREAYTPGRLCTSGYTSGCVYTRLCTSGYTSGCVYTGWCTSGYTSGCVYTGWCTSGYTSGCITVYHTWVYLRVYNSAITLTPGYTSGCITVEFSHRVYLRVYITVVYSPTRVYPRCITVVYISPTRVPLRVCNSGVHASLLPGILWCTCLPATRVYLRVRRGTTRRVLSLSSFPFHCWPVIPVLAQQCFLCRVSCSLLPFHCWRRFPVSSPLSRFTVGHCRQHLSPVSLLGILPAPGPWSVIFSTFLIF